MSTTQSIIEWNAISSRIDSVLEAWKYFYKFASDSKLDIEQAARKIFLPEFKTLLEHIKSFSSNYSMLIGDEAKKCLEQLISDTDTVIIKRNASSDSRHDLQKLQELMPIFCISKAKLSFYLKNTQTHIQKTVEVAFSHLQRQIVADSNVRNLWESTKDSEPAYEKLGATHLLMHKIWAFKANSAGERTDLVLSTPIDTNSPLFQSVDGLVLTEWKLVKDPKELKAAIEQAKSQAKRYAVGSLAPLELASCRYLVMVSKDHLKDMQHEIREGGIIYRIINIAYAPNTPSKS